MGNRHKHKYKKHKPLGLRILRILLFLVLSYGAIRLGIFGGNSLGHINADFIKNIDTENFKLALNNSMPLIDTIYNSGRIKISFAGEVKNVIKGIFDFDLSSPMTILNAQSSYFYRYYKKDYQVMLARQMEEEDKYIDERRQAANYDDAQDSNEQKDDIDNPEDSSQEPGVENKEEQTEKEPNDGEYLIAESSIEYIPEDEIKDPLKIEKVDSKGIVINNETKIKVDSSIIQKMLKEPLNIKFDKKGPQMLIYHTHTTESYIKKLEDLNKKGIQNRTQDERYNVVRVGAELKQHLESKYGFNVMHNSTINDYIYNSSYAKGRTTAEQILKGNPSIKIIFDVHRDAVRDGHLRVVKEVNKKKAAQILFVVGTNQKLKHPNWKENLKLAVKLQQKLNEQAPGLARPILISENRYNQDLRNGALIIEVGGDGNLMSECLESIKYLSKAINDVLKDK